MEDQTSPTSLPGLYGAVVEFDEDMTTDQVLHLFNAVQHAEERMKEIKRVMTEGLIAWIEKNGDLEIGDIRYYVGTQKRIKCIDPQAVIDEFLNNYSYEDLVSSMSSQPFKYGTVRAKIGDARFDELFMTGEAPDLKTGKPKKVVKQVDAKYVK